jgi:hypothetical protein
MILNDPIELFQLLPTGDIISLGGTAQAEGEVTSMLHTYPNMDVHVFFGTRTITECDPEGQAVEEIAIMPETVEELMT